MLETRFKKRLPRGWSYPIGAQELSAYLEDAPGAKEKPLSFTDRAGWFHSQLDAERRDDHPYPILRLWLFRGGVLADNPDAGHWEVRVYAVPSTLRAVVRRSLLPIAMPKVRAWLAAARPDTALDGGAYCCVLTRESDARLYFEQCVSKFENPTRDEIEVPSRIEMQELTRSAPGQTKRSPRGSRLPELVCNPVRPGVPDRCPRVAGSGAQEARPGEP